MRKVVYNGCYGGFGLSEKAKDYLKERGIFFEYDYEYDSVERHDPILVEAVEVLGEDANGRCAKLCITEVPGKYMIDQYDGYESVLTPEDIVWK